MIGHELELGRFVSEKNKWAEKKILSLIDVLSRSDVRKILSIM